MCDNIHFQVFSVASCISRYTQSSHRCLRDMDEVKIEVGSSTRGSSRRSPMVRVGAKTPVKVIASSKELDKEWFTTMFRYRGWLSQTATIDEVDCKDIGEGAGEYGDLVAVTIKKATGAPDDLPRHMIAKMCPQNCPMPSFILKFIYLNESHFYNDFTVEEGGLPRPECYHVGADLKSSPPKFIILQEVTSETNRLSGCSAVAARTLSPLKRRRRHPRRRMR